MVNSEYLKDKDPKDVQAAVDGMTPEELYEYRNSFDPDEMGYDGEEGI